LPDLRRHHFQSRDAMSSCTGVRLTASRTTREEVLRSACSVRRCVAGPGAMSGGRWYASSHGSGIAGASIIGEEKPACGKLLPLLCVARTSNLPQGAAGPHRGGQLLATWAPHPAVQVFDAPSPDTCVSPSHHRYSCFRRRARFTSPCKDATPRDGCTVRLSMWRPRARASWC